MQLCRLKSLKSAVCKMEKNQEIQWFEFQPECEASSEPGNLEVGEFSLFSLVVLVRPSTDWMKPSDTGRAVCRTLSANSDVHLIQKHPPRCTQNHA